MTTATRSTTESLLLLILLVVLAIALLTAAPRLTAGLSQLLATPVSRPVKVTL